MYRMQAVWTASLPPSSGAPAPTGLQAGAPAASHPPLTQTAVQQRMHAREKGQACGGQGTPME